MQILLLHRDALPLLFADLEQQLLFRQRHFGPLRAFPRLVLSRGAFLDLGQDEAHTGGRDIGMSVEARSGIMHATIELTPHVHPLEGLLELHGSPEGKIHDG